MHPQLDMFSVELYYSLLSLYAIVLFDTQLMHQ